MKLHDLTPPKGSTKRPERKGRGIGSKGKTAGRGSKGQGARDTIPAQFEGGQLPLMQRLPKLKGFNNPFRIEYTPVNLDDIAALGESQVTIETLVERGLARKGALVKILGDGELKKAVTISAHAASKSAEAAITAAGGSIVKVELPFGHGRPPAKGNALTNR
jgi:large subunit ribosomal protein L15